MFIGTINELLMKDGFNFMGGKIYLPTVKDPSGFWKFDHKDPRLDEPLTVESELSHFYAIDDQNFYGFGIMDELRLPLTINVSKRTIDTVRINVDTLNTNYARKEFLRDQDILVGKWTQAQATAGAGRFRSWVFAGLQKFGVYCVAATETNAFNLLTELMPLYGLHALHHYKHNPLADHFLKSGTNATLVSLQESFKRWQKEEDETTQVCSALVGAPEVKE